MLKGSGFHRAKQKAGENLVVVVVLVGLKFGKSALTDEARGVPGDLRRRIEKNCREVLLGSIQGMRWVKVVVGGRDGVANGVCRHGSARTTEKLRSSATRKSRRRHFLLQRGRFREEKWENRVKRLGVLSKAWNCEREK